LKWYLPAGTFWVFSVGEKYGGCCARWYFDLQRELIFLDLPGGSDGAITALVTGFRPSEAAARMRIDTDFFITRRGGVDARDGLVEPVSYRAISVVVERAGVEGTVCIDGIPFLPDRRSILCNRIQPGGNGFLV